MDFVIATPVRLMIKKSLARHLPADLLYSFGAALYDRAIKVKTRREKEFYRKALAIIMKDVKQVRSLEEKTLWARMVR